MTLSPGRRTAALIAVYVCLSIPMRAIELTLYFTALQRILASQIFSQEGKLYVRGGDLRNKCDFAYLENPAISAAGTHLAIKARFSGRTARNFFGKCVGMGDSFDVRIAAVPFYRNGAIALRDVKVESPGRESFYVRQVRASIAESLAKQFAYGVAADAKRILEQKRDPNYLQELRRFEITGIRVTADSLVIAIEFQLAVK